MPPVDLPTALGDNRTGNAAAPSKGPGTGGHYKRGRWIPANVEDPAPSKPEQYENSSVVPQDVAAASLSQLTFNTATPNSATAAIRVEPTGTFPAAALSTAAPAQTAPPPPPAPAAGKTATGVDRGKAVWNSIQSTKNATVADREP